MPEAYSQKTSRLTYAAQFCLSAFCMDCSGFLELQCHVCVNLVVDVCIHPADGVLMPDDPVHSSSCSILCDHSDSASSDGNMGQSARPQRGTASTPPGQQIPAAPVASSSPAALVLGISADSSTAASAPRVCHSIHNRASRTCVTARHSSPGFGDITQGSHTPSH